MITCFCTLLSCIFDNSRRNIICFIVCIIFFISRWVFENPKEKITKDTKEVSVKYSEIDGKVGTALINVQERAQIIAGENSKYDVKDSKPLKIQ